MFEMKILPLNEPFSKKIHYKMNLNVLKKQTGNHRFPSYELFFHQSKFEFVFFAINNESEKPE